MPPRASPPRARGRGAGCAMRSEPSFWGLPCFGAGLPLEGRSLSRACSKQRELSACVGRGDDTVGNPHRSIFSIRAFRAYPLIEIRQTVLCRAIRGNSISVNSTLPPLSISISILCMFDVIGPLMSPFRIMTLRVVRIPGLRNSTLIWCFSS